MSRITSSRAPLQGSESEMLRSNLPPRKTAESIASALLVTPTTKTLELACRDDKVRKRCTEVYEIELEKPHREHIDAGQQPREGLSLLYFPLPLWPGGNALNTVYHEDTGCLGHGLREEAADGILRLTSGLWESSYFAARGESLKDVEGSGWLNSLFWEMMRNLIDESGDHSV